MYDNKIVLNRKIRDTKKYGNISHRIAALVETPNVGPFARGKFPTCSLRLAGHNATKTKLINEELVKLFALEETRLICCWWGNFVKFSGGVYGDFRNPTVQ